MDQTRKEWETAMEQKLNNLEASMLLNQNNFIIANEEWKKLAEESAEKCRNIEEENKILKSEIENCKRKENEMLTCWQNVDKRLKESSINVTKIDKMTMDHEHNSNLRNHEGPKHPSLEERMTNLEGSLHKALNVMLPRVDSVLSTMGSVPVRDNPNAKVNRLASFEEREKKENLMEVSETIGDTLNKDSHNNIFPFLSYKPSLPKMNSLRYNSQNKNSIGNAITFSRHDNIMFLLNAVKNNNTDEVLDLLNSGFHVNACNEHGLTGLHTAAEFGYIRITSIFLERGADANFEDASGMTPIFNAASNRNVACISLLANAGADVNARAKDGTTALHQAALCGDVETIRALLRVGAITSATDSEGWTPLHWAVVWGSKETGALLEAGCNNSTPDKHGKTPLHLAVVSGRTDTAKLLLEAGASLMEVNKKNMTPSELNRTENTIMELRAGLRKKNDASSLLFTNLQDKRNEGSRKVVRKKRSRKMEMAQ